MTNLRVLRRLKNVSVKELAKRAGISAMTICFQLLKVVTEMMPFP